MDDIIKILTSPRRLKTALKPMELAQLAKAIELLNNIKTEREDEIRIEAERQRKEQEELEAIKLQMIEKGLDVNKLASLMSGVKPRKKSTRGKKATSKIYKYGDDKTWDGNGEIPPELQKELDEGFTLSDFEVTN